MIHRPQSTTRIGPTMRLLAVALVCAGAAWLGGSFDRPRPAHADAPSLAISKSASPDPVVAGEELTYLLTITNTGQTALSDIVVSDTIPANTTFVSAGYFDGNWGVWVPSRGETGTVRWEAQVPLPSQQAMQLQLVVLVAPATAGSVINDSYDVRAGDAGPVMGRPVTVRVVAPPPTPTPKPTLTPTPAPSFTPTPTARPTPTTTPTPTTGSQATPVPSPQPTPPPSENAGWPTTGFVVGVIIVVALALWRLPRRS